MTDTSVHGYDARERLRLQDQASTLAELQHVDTVYPSSSRVLEAGCGVGAQTVALAGQSPHALITSIDISRTTEHDGVFRHTFFKAWARKDKRPTRPAARGASARTRQARSKQTFLHSVSVNLTRTPTVE